MDLNITQTTPILRTAKDHGVFLQWDVANPPSSEIRFNVERSGSLEGPWERIVNGLVGYHFFDRQRTPPAPKPGEEIVDFNYLSLARTVYYRVTATSADGIRSEEISDVGASLPRHQVLLKRKMQTDLAIGFRFNGVDVAILKRRHWGVRCARCFDNNTRKVLSSKCVSCFGTGFTGGYFNPVRITGRFLAPSADTQLTQHGKTDITQVRFICGQTPAVDVDDVIVEIAQNRRYIVLSQSETQLRRETVHQSIVLSELSRDSVEYKFPAKLDDIPAIY